MFHGSHLNCSDVGVNVTSDNAGQLFPSERKGIWQKSSRTFPFLSLGLYLNKWMFKLEIITGIEEIDYRSSTTGPCRQGKGPANLKVGHWAYPVWEMGKKVMEEKEQLPRDPRLLPTVSTQWGSPKGRRKRGAERVFEEMLTGNFQNFI